MGNKEILEKMKNERLGETNISKEQYIMKIIEYNGATNMIVEFQDEHKYRKKCAYKEFKNGNIKNPYHPNVYGVGYLGEGKYNCTDDNGKITKVYKTWSSMMERCYDPYKINKEPTYADVFVCKEWHNFQNFAKWWEENYYDVLGEKMHLDKDILYKGNKIYSPETCIFVPQRINSLFLKSNKARGVYPIGVHCKHETIKIYEYDYLVVYCGVIDNKTKKCKRKYLGRFPLNKPFQAFYTYKQFKENYIKQIADEYKDLIPQKLYDAMYSYEVEIND